MAKRRARNRRTTLPLEALEPEVRRHIRSLGFETAETYLSWCRAHRFPATWEKTRHQLRAEREYAERLSADERLKTRHARTRVSEPALERLLDGRTEGVQVEVARVASFFVDGAAPRIQQDFARRLFRATPAGDLAREVGRTGLTVARVLIRIARHAEHALRTLDGWRERTHNIERRMLSLVRHLYVGWEVPDCLTRAWLETGVAAERHRGWFIHLGAGHNIRTAPELPLPYSRRMAHAFLQAPSDYDVGAALRYGQVLGLGGDAELAEAVRGTRLREEFVHDEFWSSVLRFFIAHPDLDRVHFGPIVDFLHYHRFEEQRFVRLDGREAVEPPPQPHLSMRGRTPESLLRQVDAWHARLGRVELGKGDYSWSPQGWVPYRHVERRRDGEQGRTWEIHELTSSAALRAEGNAMNHCVAIYASYCRAGRSAIFSMTCGNGGGAARRALTIEVRLGRKRVEQALGRNNRRARPIERTHLGRWARAMGLEVADWV